MKYKILIFLLLVACSTDFTNNLSKTPYISSGFAYIYNDTDYTNKVIKKKFDNDKFMVGHDRLPVGTLLRITNPDNKKSKKIKINKKVDYPEFYKILITKKISDELSLNGDAPFVEINTIKKNKSFVAAKAVIFNEEKKVHSTAPVAKVRINNISKTDEKKKVKNKKFSIIIGNFYSKNTAIDLKKNLTKISNFNINKRLSIITKGKNSFQLQSGPYQAINSLKNDYIAIKRYGFEDLEILLHE